MSNIIAKNEKQRALDGHGEYGLANVAVTV
jgi:hypothetical protein